MFNMHVTFPSKEEERGELHATVVATSALVKSAGEINRDKRIQ